MLQTYFIEVGIDVIDKSPFFIRPYHAKEEDTKVIDKELKCLCYLGTLKEGFSPYSSLVMLISRKVTQDKRAVIDFRHLNIRIAKNNLAYPLVRETFSLLSNSKCEVISVLDLKDAFHSLRLLEDAKDIVVYYHISEAPHTYIRECLWDRMYCLQLAILYKHILECLQSRKYCEAIMGDILLFTHSKRAHIAKLEDLLKALLKNSLKIYPKKCQSFKTELLYMENILFVKDRQVCVKPLRSKCEAIQKIWLLTTPKGCRIFAGMVNFLSMFCPEIQELLKPIHDLTRKGRQFIWGKEQQEAFEEIKHRLIKDPILHKPNCEGRFHLYSDISKFAAESALYQTQNGKPKMIAYVR